MENCKQSLDEESGIREHRLDHHMHISRGAKWLTKNSTGVSVTSSFAESRIHRIKREPLFPFPSSS